MTRREFPAKVRTAVIKRATHNDVAICEKCGAMAKRFQIDHVRPDGLLGEPTIENAMLICEACYRKRTRRMRARLLKPRGARQNTSER
jgi:5-methylcytosine-specific restriction endonuclease McrA